MSKQSQTIKTLSNLKSDIKIQLIEYYDSIKCEIDLQAQLALDSFKNASISSTTLDEDEVIELNEELIKISDEILNLNIEDINEYFSGHKEIEFLNSEDVKRGILKSYCTFIGNDTLTKEFKDKNPLGVFIISDWYLDQNQLQFLRKRFVVKDENDELIKFAFDANVLMLAYGIKNSKAIIKIPEKRIFKNVFIFEKDKLKNGLASLDEFDKDAYKIYTPISIDLKNLNSHLGNLRSLTLKFSSLEKISISTFKSLPKLEKLDMSCNDLINLEEGIFNGLNNLRELRLWYSSINELDDNVFKPLKSLEKIYLSKNKIKSLNENTFSGLENLQRCFIAHNLIEEIKPNTFISLKNLIELDLSHNQIRRLSPETFSGLGNLEKLNLTKANIEYIKPNTFKRLVKLKELNLDENRIGKIEAKTFYKLDKLQKLDLEYNQIDEIEDYSFITLTSLKDLNLCNNKIKSVNNKMFYGMANLLMLDLSTNEIELVSNYDFKSNLINLSCLDLSQNKIKSIEPKAFNGLENMETLFIHTNPMIELAFNLEQFKRYFSLENLKELVKMNIYIAFPYD